MLCHFSYPKFYLLDTGSPGRKTFAREPLTTETIMLQRLLKFGFGPIGIEPGETVISFHLRSSVRSARCRPRLCILPTTLPARPSASPVVGFVVALTTNFLLNRRHLRRQAWRRRDAAVFSVFAICTLGFDQLIVSVSLFERTAFFTALSRRGVSRTMGACHQLHRSKYIAFR